MDTAEYLARVGFDAILADLGGPTPTDIDDRPGVTTIADHDRVRAVLLDTPAVPRSHGRQGVEWFRRVTWPDRVPGLKTWAARATLPGIIAGHQRRLREAPGDLFAATGVYRTGDGEGPSGFDARTCQDARDIGFSPANLGMDIACRPGVELLAVVGAEWVPLVSYGPRECGLLHAGRVWRFTVEPRDGGYFHRWGRLVSSGSQW